MSISLVSMKARADIRKNFDPRLPLARNGPRPANGPATSESFSFFIVLGSGYMYSSCKRISNEWWLEL